MKTRFLFFFLCISTIISAQNYTYITDRRFKSPEDLVGYSFQPNHMEIPNEYDEKLKPGTCSFAISANNLYVEGNPDIKGVYNINQINSMDYGYKILLMNPRNPAEQGHLKVILTPQKWVEALVFKRAKSEPETIFFLAQISDKLRNREEDYFTNRWDFSVASSDSLWGKDIQPFLAISGSGIQNRFSAKDSTKISFIEKITIIEKEKKKKKKKKMNNIELGIPDEEMDDEVEVEVIEEEEEEEEVEEVEVRRRAYSYPGSSSDNASRSNSYPGEEEEEEVEIEVDVEAEALVEEKLIDEAGEEHSKEEESNIKRKITKEYFIKVSYVVKNDLGVDETLSKLFPIKKIVEREDESAGPGQDKYQIEFTLKKGNPIYLYLTSKRTISYMQIAEETFLMRGH